MCLLLPWRLGSAMLRQALFHYGQDTSMHRFDSGIAFDGDDTRGLALGNSAVLVVHTAEEGGVERFEAIFILAGDCPCGLVALARAGKRRVKVRQQEQGEVRIEA